MVVLVVVAVVVVVVVAVVVRESTVEVECVKDPTVNLERALL